MRALLASPLGFIIGISLGALGGGGSILAVPALVYAAGQSPREATATSLLLVGTASLIGVVPHWRAGRVRMRTGAIFGAAGIGGSLLGTALNHRLDPDVLLLAFSGLVVVAAWRMLTGCPTCTRVGETTTIDRHLTGTGRTTATLDDPPPRTTWLQASTIVKILIAGTFVGFLTGLFGVGGGFVIVPALALVLKLPMPEAIGTSLLVVAVNSAVALTSRLASTNIDWATTVPFTVAAIAGVLTGGRVADRLDPERSLRWFAALLAAVAVYTAIDAGTALL